MSERNGSTTSPAKTAARNTAGFFQDLVTLSELQAKLAKAELQQSVRSVVRPGLFLIVAAAIALGCIPVLLLSLAYLLTDAGGLPHGWSLLIAGGAGLIAVATLTLMAIRQFKKGMVGFPQSIEELKFNINWIKQTLKNNSKPAQESMEA